MDINRKDTIKLPLMLSYSLFILIFSTYIVWADEECYPQMKFAGYTRPSGDIYVEVGKELDITCTVNKLHSFESPPSGNLYFEAGSNIVPRNMVQVLNSSSIRLVEPQLEKKSITYLCKLDKKSPDNLENVCINKVIVDSHPDNVTDFKCISHNWSNLNCSWTKQKTYTTINYSLEYSFRYGRRSSRYVCPKIVTDTPKAYCYWNDDSTPQYRPSQPDYYFVLNSTNTFGSTLQHFRIQHWKYVKFDKPKNFVYKCVTTDMICLHWEIDAGLAAFPEGFEHRVQWQCVHDEKVFKEITFKTNSSLQTKDFYYNLTNLRYPYDVCDVRISIRSAVADSDEMWSPFEVINVRLNSTIPDRPPEVPKGSFYLIDSGTDMSYRDAYIFWKSIPDSSKNGGNFRYRVHMVTPDEKAKVNRTTDTYAKVINLEKNKKYEFEIWSENNQGPSLKKSFLEIPADQHRPRAPEVDPKTAYGNTFELSWRLKPFHRRVTNYTIYWCNHDWKQVTCTAGIAGWKVVDGSETSVNITTGGEKQMDFAISANSDSGSSGMAFMSCTVIHDGEIHGKLSNVWIASIGPTYMELRWEIECDDKIPSVRGYQIYYCEVDGLTKDCLGPQENRLIEGDGSLRHWNLTSLKPYTTYRLAIAVKSKNNVLSEQSDVLFNTTLEDAPSQLKPVTKLATTNSSIAISWEAPEKPNGKKITYNIYYKNNSTNRMFSEAFIPSNTAPFKKILTNLTSYVLYEIQVEACTSLKCSPKSQPVYIRTNMGYPSKVPRPHERKDSSGPSRITWEAPAYPAGPNNYYIVRVTEVTNKNNATYSTVSERTKDIEDCKPDGKFTRMLIAVCAVNIENGKNFTGPWSEEYEYDCNKPSTSSLLIVAFSVTGGLIGAVFIAKWLYHRCRSMRNVEIKLPPGLQIPAGMESLSSWNDNADNPPHKPPADEEYLLEKLSEGRSGESSGCSSGHDSVTSLDAGANECNTSDSGTEQPPKSPSEKSPIINNKTEISVSKPYVTADSLPKWNSPLPAPGDYCMLGVNPIPPSEPETTYVPNTAPTPAPSKGYVTMPVNGVSTPTWNPKSPPPTGNYCVLGLNPEASSKNYVTVANDTNISAWDSNSARDNY